MNPADHVCPFCHATHTPGGCPESSEFEEDTVSETKAYGAAPSARIEPPVFDDETEIVDPSRTDDSLPGAPARKPAAATLAFPPVAPTTAKGVAARAAVVPPPKVRGVLVVDGAPAKPLDPLVGQLVANRYRVQDVIARGGMGVVYDAIQIDLGRRVALKTLALMLSTDRASVARFRNEARAASSLGHPNIIDVSDLGVLPNGTPYLVMERLQGETLGALITREGCLAPDVLLRILSQILSALATAHQMGILHRDLKPENVFLATRLGLPPTVKILDFGIAKQIGEQRTGTELTHAGSVVGTMGYMAPEQARAERDLDGRADLFAVGAIAYEALAGRMAYPVPVIPPLVPAELYLFPPEPLAEQRPDLPGALIAFVERLMAPRREDRFATASDALGAIATIGGWDP